MYHFVVRQKLRRSFRDINAGRYAAIVAQFASRHSHTMFGPHALGGQRRTLASTREWYARLHRLLPDLRFEIQSMAVTGWPWDTRALVSWTDSFTLPFWRYSTCSHGSPWLKMTSARRYSTIFRATPAESRNV